MTQAPTAPDRHDEPDGSNRNTNVAKGGSALSVADLWKIFGPGADKIIGTAEADLPRPELLKKTGCTAAVKDITFDVAPGEVFVVMGLSGSGKSTLVRCLTRLIEPTAGSVRIGDTEVTSASDGELRDLRRGHVSMVFQHFGLLPHRAVIDNVAYGLEVRGMGKSERRAKAGKVVELVGLEGYEASYPDQLSGGMQQRVGLARALANDPSLLLFDEPFSALDPLIRRDMQDEVIRLQRDVRKTMIFITHDLAEALKLGDRIAIMKDGKFVQVGTPEEVVAHPADDYVADFTRDVPRAHVLTVRTIMRGMNGDADYAGDIDAGEVVQSLLPKVAQEHRPFRVVDGGTQVGVVDRTAVLEAMIEAR